MSCIIEDHDGEMDKEMNQSATGVMENPTAYSSHQRALFVLKAREVNKLSQQALFDIMTDFTVIMEGMLDSVYEKQNYKITIFLPLILDYMRCSMILNLKNRFEIYTPSICFQST